MTISNKILVVGLGFSGAVVARELADQGLHVLAIDKRSHLAGNAYDEENSQKILVHRYGPHIFHTNSYRIFKYLSRFTKWRSYEHRVLTEIDGRLLPIPINRTTINQLYDLNLDEKGIANYLASVRIPINNPKTSEDVVLASVGEDLCNKFFRGYTLKQWGLDLSELAAGVAARIPVRCNDDDRYFTDTYQAMPSDGYSAMFDKIIRHPNIQVKLGIDYLENRGAFPATHTVFTGPIDAFFDQCYGPLPYRSLSFEHEHLPSTQQFQSVGTVNYPNQHAYTRITEFKHLTGQRATGTSIVREYPQISGEPYYPIPRPDNEKLYRYYRALAKNCGDVTFVGRLAEYRYYNMDQAVGAALSAAQKIIQRLNSYGNAE